MGSLRNAGTRIAGTRNAGTRSAGGLAAGFSRMDWNGTGGKTAGSTAGGPGQKDGWSACVTGGHRWAF